MNRLGWVALGTFLVLSGLWFVGLGSSIRDDVECNDTDKCEVGPIAVKGWMVFGGGVVIMIAGLTSVLRARTVPPPQN